MNKKVNYLAAIPVFGSVIVLFWLFIKSAKKEIDSRKFNIYFICCAFFGGFSILGVTLCLNFINSIVDISFFVENYAMFFVYILGGYLLNLYTFLLVNKHWNELFNNEIDKQVSFLEINKKKIIYAGIILSIVVTIIAIIMVIIWCK